MSGIDFSSYRELTFNRDGRVLTVTLNRPEFLNTVTIGLGNELIRVFNEISEDSATHVVVLTGAGRAFSAGGSIDDMPEFSDHSDMMIKATNNARGIVQGIIQCWKPVIAKVNGAAVGQGLTMALVSDIIFASTTAKMSDPHVSMGMSAAAGSMIWPQLVGYARAKQYLLTGDWIDPVEAERIGLINFAVPPEQLDARVSEFAQRLANGASRAIQYTKRAINLRLRDVSDTVVEAGIAFETLTGQTEDHQEAVRAFKEKRPPRFEGR